MFAKILDDHHLVPDLLGPPRSVCTPQSREADNGAIPAIAMADEDTHVKRATQEPTIRPDPAPTQMAINKGYNSPSIAGISFRTNARRSSWFFSSAISSKSIMIGGPMGAAECDSLEKLTEKFGHFFGYQRLLGGLGI